MAAKMVLVVDDDPQIRELLDLYFMREGFAVEQAADGGEALVKIEHCQPDIVVLDIMMPVLDGLEVCRQVRKTSNIPIVMLTARIEDEDRILGLEMGADDYMGKPFNPRELVARVKAVLRRVPGEDVSEAEVLYFPDLVINKTEYCVTAFTHKVALTAKEIDLLYHLASHPGRVYTRNQLLETVWGYTYCGDTGTVDTHVKRLRHKIGASKEGRWAIKTVWGVGYKFEAKL